MLNRMALRLCVVQALLGQTFAGNNVKDSEITVIDPQSGADEPLPFIAVYTDDQTGGKDVSIVLEIGATAAMTTSDAEGNAQLVAGVPLTDAGLEIRIDLIERQIHSALAHEENEWSELVRILGSFGDDIKSVRGASKSETGERFSGRQLVMQCSLLAEPQLGYLPEEGDFWFKFLAMLEGNDSLKGFVALFKTHLSGETLATDWKQTRRAITASSFASRSLGIAPIVGDEIPPLSEFDVCVSGK